MELEKSKKDENVDVNIGLKDPVNWEINVILRIQGLLV